MHKLRLPNATAVLVLGILSILSCWLFGIVGLILGIIALVLAQKDITLYQKEPEKYLDYNILNIGRVLAIIGVILSAIYLAFVIFIYGVIGIENFKEWEENLNNKLEYERQQ